MKAVSSKHLRLVDRSRRFKALRSSALLIVLGCLALISVLILGFFYSVTTERQSAQFYANTSSVKSLSDSTVSLVMGMIKDATKGTDSNGKTLAWASQPGMIRTFDQNGQPVGFYKLYSWNNMVTNSFVPANSTETPPANWSASPSVYTDLNDPVAGVYPIVDPAATNLVKGFSLSGAPVSAQDAAPMPVKWLYVLQNGKIIAPDVTSSGNTATFLQASSLPASTNQIVARLAYWTDDETCKVNVNTAAGDVWFNASSSSTAPALATTANPDTGNPGSFWDTPRNGSVFETNLATYQPANGEYQRYPGHPATTYLSAVFPNILTKRDWIYQIVPRVSQGGSYGGSTFSTNSILATLDNDRLYSSMDELLLNTNRLINSPLTKTNLEQAKFFLTANSRAPEVNLYNEPRVVIWPENVNNDSNHRTAYDGLIAYCGTVNSNTFYFQRNDPTSTNNDLPSSASSTGLGRNRQLISYLRNLTSQPVPGFSQAGKTFYSKYGPADRDQILTEIFDYVRALNTQDINAGSSFLSFTTNSGVGEGQIVPITDVSSDGTTPLRGFGHMPVITEASLLFSGIGQVAGTNVCVFPSNVSPLADGKTRIQGALLIKLFDPCQGYAFYVPNFKVKATNLSGMTWGPSSTSMGFPDPATVKVSRILPLSWGAGEWGILEFVYSSGYMSPTSGFVGQNTLDCTTGQTFAFGGGTITVQILDAATGTIPYQTYKLNFPSGTFPVPDLAPGITDLSATSNNVCDYRNLTANNSPTFTNNLITPPQVSINSALSRFNPSNGAMAQTIICGKDVVRSVALVTDPRLVATYSTVDQTNFAPIVGYNSTTIKQVHGIIEPINGNHRGFVGAILGKLAKGVTYSSVSNPYAPGNASADFSYANTNTIFGIQPQISTLNNSTPYSGVSKGLALPDPTSFQLSGGYAMPTTNGVTLPGSSTLPGDWDNGTGLEKDGAYINKADEGAVPYLTGTNSSLAPYFGAGYNVSYSSYGVTIAKGANFSPNRQMPSAGMFGSLPSGAKSGRPYQTLLFRPDPDGTQTHIGAQIPGDNLLLDLFSMPVVEPYAISDPFSTAGKVNMNYQIIPFSSYMTRNTAVQAVMRSEQILAIPATAGTTYKNFGNTAKYRYYLDLNETLNGVNGTLYGFKQRFDSGDIFRSASEICNIWLVPAGLGKNYSDMQNFWLDSTTAGGGGLTGDNSRERPYANIYPRLTTKSNSFTVHMRVQTLKQIKGVDVTSWQEGTDVITGEYRGSSTLERYLDLNNTQIPDYATEPQPLAAGKAIDNFYKFRVVETKQFTP